MRHLRQKEAQNERDFFSKKNSGRFVLINNRDLVTYPQQFIVTGYDNFESGVLGLTRPRHTTHVRVCISGESGHTLAVRFIGGHHEKRRYFETYTYEIPLSSEETEVLVRIHPKDTGIVFMLDPETIDDLTGEEDEVRCEGSFEFVEIKRYMLFSRMLNKYT
jgi:hypothetical protein